MVKGLQAGDIWELLLEKAVNPVQAVLPLCGEEVEVAGNVRCWSLLLVRTPLWMSNTSP